MIAVALVVFAIFTLSFVTATTFHSVSNLKVRFNSLNELIPEEKMKIVSSESAPIDEIHRLLRAECLFDYLTTGSRSHHCIPSTKGSRFNRLYQQSPPTDNLSAQDTKAPLLSGLTPFELHPLLIPLEAYPAPGVGSSEEFGTLGSHQELSENQHRQSSHTFATTTALPPFGDSISISFTLDLSNPSENAFRSAQLAQSEFQFDLTFKSDAVTPTTRLQLVDNSLRPPHIDLDLQSTQDDHITHLYGVLGSTYQGQRVNQFGEIETLILTILDRGQFEAILIRPDDVYAIQPPQLIIPTYEAVDAAQGQTSSQFKTQQAPDAKTSSDQNQHQQSTTTSHIDQLHEALSQSSTWHSTSPQTLDKIEHHSATLFTSATIPTRQHSRRFENMATGLEPAGLEHGDVDDISSLFFATTHLKQLNANISRQFQQPGQTTLLTQSMIEQAMVQQIAPVRYLATSTKHFRSQLDRAANNNNNSTNNNQTSFQTSSTKTMQKIFDCQVMDPVTDSLVDDHHHFGDKDDHHQNQNNSPVAMTTAQVSQFRQLGRWTNCIRKPDNTFLDGFERLQLGVVIDNGAYIAHGNNTGAALARLLSGLAWGNNIYPTQTGLYFTLETVIIMTNYVPSQDPSWNNNGKQQQSITTSQLLSNLAAYRRMKFPTKLAILSLMTNLYPPPGVVGLAYLNSIGLSHHASSWANLSNFYFLTFIHELSHNHSAQHTFGANEGSIMSYDLSGRIGSKDPENQGLVGLNTVTTRSAFCTYLTSVYRQTQRPPSPSTMVPIENVFTPYEGSVCGNGVLETGEECDSGLQNGVPNKTSGRICCTVDCKLTPGSTCAPPRLPGFTANSEASYQQTACCKDCVAQPAQTQCGSGRSTGFCGRDGSCVISGCNAFNGIVPCGRERFQVENPCIQQCNALNQTNSKDACYPMFSTPLLYVQQGTHCAYQNGTKGVCTIDNFPTPPAGLHQRPIPMENYIELGQKPYCKISPSYSLQVTDSTRFKPCGCDGYSTVFLACLENSINYVDLDKCRIELNQWYPSGAYVRCTPPPYCKI